MCIIFISLFVQDSSDSSSDSSSDDDKKKKKKKKDKKKKKKKDKKKVMWGAMNAKYICASFLSQENKVNWSVLHVLYLSRTQARVHLIVTRKIKRTRRTRRRRKR